MHKANGISMRAALRLWEKSDEFDTVDVALAPLEVAVCHDHSTRHRSTQLACIDLEEVSIMYLWQVAPPQCLKLAVGVL